MRQEPESLPTLQCLLLLALWSMSGPLHCLGTLLRTWPVLTKDSTLLAQTLVCVLKKKKRKDSVNQDFTTFA